MNIPHYEIKSREFINTIKSEISKPYPTNTLYLPYFNAIYFAFIFVYINALSPPRISFLR